MHDSHDGRAGQEGVRRDWPQTRVRPPSSRSMGGDLAQARSTMWLCLAGAAVLAAVGTHPLRAQNPDRSESSDPAEREPRYARAETVPETLLEKRGRDVVILPSQPAETHEIAQERTQGTRMVLEAERPLLPEGYVVASRRAQIRQAGDWHEVELAKAEGLPEAPPLRMLPNQRLGVLEAILSASQEQPAFVVTGRVTEFQGRNYLLLESLEEVSHAAAASQGRAGAEPGSGEAAQAAAGVPGRDEATVAGATSATGGAPGSAGVPTAEEIINRLLQQEVVRPVVVPEQEITIEPQADTEPPGGGEAAGGGDGAAKHTSWPEEALLINRAGRILPGDQWWMFAFEDHGRHPAGRPIRLLPNRLLESAIRLAKGQTEGTVLIVSGEITLHRNVNYLLLRKVLVRRDLGNLH